MLGLLARAAERHPSERPMQVARLTVDLMRAAPMEPVTTECRTYRQSRSLDIVEASLLCKGKEFARASAMRFVINPVRVPEDFRGEAPRLMPPASDEAQMNALGVEDREAFHHALDIRPTPGFALPVVWLRLRLPLVDGEEPSPLVRVATAADFTYSMPTMRKIMNDPEGFDHQDFVSINPDTSLNLHRPMVGEWVGLDCRVFYSEQGAGSASAQIHDESGVIGHASQSLLVRDASQQTAIWKDSQSKAGGKAG